MGTVTYLGLINLRLKNISSAPYARPNNKILDLVHADNGNITSMTRQDTNQPSTETLTYTYDTEHPHAVKEIKFNGTGAPVCGRKVIHR